MMEQYNAALVIILVVFLIFAFATGRSLGSLYCAKTEKDAQDAQMNLLFNLLFAGLFGWWAYYEHKKCQGLAIVLLMESKKIAMDPNIESAMKKNREMYAQSRETRETRDTQKDDTGNWSMLDARSGPSETPPSSPSPGSTGGPVQPAEIDPFRAADADPNRGDYMPDTGYGSVNYGLDPTTL